MDAIKNTLFLVSQDQIPFFNQYLHVISIGKNVRNKFLQKIVKYLMENNIQNLFINCHCKVYPSLFKYLDRNKVEIKIFGTHQKERYIPRNLIPRMEKILEYAPNASKISFPKSFNIDHADKYIHFKFPTYVPDELILFLRKKKTKKYYFAGGVHGRDYDTLIKAFSQIPDKLIICAKRTKRGNNIKHGLLPSNISWVENIPRINFLKLMARAKAVILPIPPGDNVLGHTSLSEAIALGKPIISVNEASLVENLVDKHNSIIIKNQPQEYIRAVNYLNQKNNYQKLKKNMETIQDTRLVSSHLKFIESLIRESNRNSN